MTLFGKIIMGAFLLVVAGGVYYGVKSFATNNETPVVVQQTISTTTEEVIVGSSTMITTGTSTATSTSDKPAGKKIAFSEFMKKGGSYKCSVTQNMATMTTQGTIYIHDKMVKGNFSVSLAGQTIQTNMIVRDGYSYTWTNSTPTTGIKTKIATSASGKTSTSTMTWTGEQIGDYSCVAWVTDDTVFELPKTVTFTVS
jgi:hypothetical protein